MKKVLIMVLLLLAFCSSAFATCNIDLDRWKLIVPTERTLVYFDTQTVKKSGPTSFSAWICNYYAGIKSDCCNSICIEKGYNKKEHYHYLSVGYDYEACTISLKELLKKDDRGNVFQSYRYPYPEEETRNIPPGSIAEETMIKIKEYTENREKRMNIGVY